MPANVFLQAADAVAPQHEPQLQRSETPAQRHTPMSVVDRCVVVTVLQVERVDDQRRRQQVSVSDPQKGAVEAGEHHLIGICVDRIGELDPGQVILMLRAKEGAAGVRRVHMEPYTRELSHNRPNFR